MIVRPITWLLILAGAAGVALAVGRWFPPSSPPAWETSGIVNDVEDSLTVVVAWTIDDDGRGAADSIAVTLATRSASGLSSTQSRQYTTRTLSDSFRVMSPPAGAYLDLTVTVRASRRSQTSRPVVASWRFPASPSWPAPRVDSGAPHRLLLDVPALGFGRGAPRAAPGGPAAQAPAPTVTPPAASPSLPVGNSDCANEPPGFQAVSREMWNDVPRPGRERKEPGWFAAAHRERFTIIEDPTIPQASKRVIQGLFPQGHPGGRGPFKLVQRFQEPYHALYMCMWHKVSDNFTNNGNTGTKFGFLLTPYEGGAQGVHAYLNLSNQLGINLSSRGGVLNRNMRSRFAVLSNRGRWHRIEWLIVANSRGESDGIARIWVDGRQMLNETNVKYFFPNQEPKFVGITWNPTYGGGLNPVPFDMFQWNGEWYISAR
jgi:hypothetical protein